MSKTNNKQIEAAYKKGCEYLEDELFSEAAKCFQTAAEQGHAGAQSALGQLYMGGMGVEEDHKKGVMWLRKAAAQNDPAACFGLGYNYMTGFGLRQSDEKAKIWFQKAIENGSRTAQMWLDTLNEQ